MTGRNPWKLGSLNDALVKAEAAGGKSSVTLLKAVLDILNDIDCRISLIEAEDARRLAAKEASENFRKGISHD
jgi:hypothetical protein